MVFGDGFVQLGAVTDYDVITIGGKQYSANQVLDKSITASRDTKTYSRPAGTVLGTIKAGQVIGNVFSYIKPTQAADGRGWLMFESSYNKYFYIPDEATSPKLLDQQGAKTVTQEIKEEQDAKAKEDDPISYYAKKLVLPGVLIVAGIYAVVQLGKTAIEKKL